MGATRGGFGAHLGEPVLAEKLQHPLELRRPRRGGGGCHARCRRCAGRGSAMAPEEKKVHTMSLFDSVRVPPTPKCRPISRELRIIKYL